jgi:hypothetical protein
VKAQAPVAAAASAPRGEMPAPPPKVESKELKKILKEWKKLSPEDQARFLELVGQNGGAP